MSVRTALRDVQHSTVPRVQLYAVPFAIGWGFGSEIDHYVENCSPRATDQLGLECGHRLKVHASKSSLSYTKAHILLHRHKINTMFGKFPNAPRSREVSTIIFPQNRIDQCCAAY